MDGGRGGGVFAVGMSSAPGGFVATYFQDGRGPWKRGVKGGG